VSANEKQEVSTMPEISPVGQDANRLSEPSYVNVGMIISLQSE